MNEMHRSVRAEKQRIWFGLEARRSAAVMLRCAGPSAKDAVKSEGETICITNSMSCCTRDVQGRITQLEDFQQSACQFVETGRSRS
jgi:hypothetical protein